MSTFVVDASVAVKWSVPEVHADAAVRVRDGRHDLHVPGFFDTELANVLWKKVRRAELTQDRAAAILAETAVAPLSRHPDLPLMSAAFAIAVDTGRTVYDSTYVALAVRLGCQAVTADRRLWNALRGTAWEQHLLWVEDVP